MDYAIEILHVTKDFPRLRRLRDIAIHPFTVKRDRVLEDISIKIRRGSITAILGPNGAGKTTLLRIVSGIVVPDSGEVRVFGKNISNAGSSLYSKVGLVVGDERSFYIRLTARQNLEFFASLHNLFGRDRDDKISGILETLSLTRHEKKPFSDLSSGMKQRLALARVLLADPDILLFDEITKGLDIGQAARFRAMLKNDVRGEMGKTVVFATHNMDEAAELSDNVILLDRGRDVKTGTMEEVKPFFETVFNPDEGRD